MHREKNERNGNGGWIRTGLKDDSGTSSLTHSKPQRRDVPQQSFYWGVANKAEKQNHSRQNETWSAFLRCYFTSYVVVLDGWTWCDTYLPYIAIHSQFSRLDSIGLFVCDKCPWKKNQNSPFIYLQFIFFFIFTFSFPYRPVASLLSVFCSTTLGFKFFFYSSSMCFRFCSVFFVSFFIFIFLFCFMLLVAEWIQCKISIFICIYVLRPSGDDYSMVVFLS